MSPRARDPLDWEALEPCDRRHIWTRSSTLAFEVSSFAARRGPLGPYCQTFVVLRGKPSPLRHCMSERGALPRLPLSLPTSSAIVALSFLHQPTRSSLHFARRPVALKLALLAVYHLPDLPLVVSRSHVGFMEIILTCPLRKRLLP